MMKKHTIQLRWHWLMMLSVVLCLCLTPGFVATASSQDTGDEREYKIKAAFIYNFIRFTKWPDNGKKPMVISVLGKNPFGKSSFEAVENKVIPTTKRKLIVKELGEFKEGMDLKKSDVLFISSSEKDNFKEILKNIGNARVLTVADSEGFIVDGGMINLVLKGRNVRWELNAGAVKKSSLKLNSQLYRSAVKVVGN
jgi:hypothetical protein